MITWDKDSDNIVLLTLDDPDHGANTMNDAYVTALDETLARLESEKDTVSGVIIISAKKSFFAGGNLEDLYSAGLDQAAEVSAKTAKVKAQLRAIETLGKPVVAALNGSALGGGLEIALATHHRIAINDPRLKVGLPEVTLGLLPGGGGVTRLVRKFGIADALMKFLLQGQQYGPEKALELGVIDELATDKADLIAKAKTWIKANPDAAAPWDFAGYKIPGGTPSNPKFAANLPAFPANLRKQLKGAPLQAPRAILAAAVEGSQVDFANAQLIEGRYFTELVTGQGSKNMIKAFFFDMNHISGGGSRPAGYPKHVAKKVVVLGAGMMGAGIAYAFAKVGVEVHLKDVSQEAADRGRGYSLKLVEKDVTRGRLTQAAGDKLIALIHPTDNVEGLSDVDLVVEAVFESVPVKNQVFGEIEPAIAPDAVLASNTSTLPITELANGVKRPADFIGMHFFSPVDKMKLVEIIVGEKTSDATLAKIIDITAQIRKVPIVVNDSRGFFTSRVITTRINEAIRMVAEGISPVSIEQSGKQSGYPAPSLQLCDELTLTLMQKIRNATRAGIEAAGGHLDVTADEQVVNTLLENDRKGKSTGSGFYDYADGHRTKLWPGLAENFGKNTVIPFDDIKDRQLFAEVLETVKCFDEKVLRSIPDANIGSILGIGFPVWTGGVIQFIAGYKGGVAGFVARAKELEAAYGERFAPPASLTENPEFWTAR
jgi:3-hydroxyacyl-CoA dehydrogenase/enoyl-CoA hydratase/3-hydroxybutyryl-CoA epimerase